MTSISSFTGSDLAPMRTSLNTITSMGAPQTAAAAGQVLGQGAGYLQGAQQTMAKLDESIERRTKAIGELEATNPGAATKDREQLDLLQRLRDRINLSIERVTAILSDKDPESVKNDAHAQQQLDDLERLEQRRRLLASEVSFTQPMAATQVASAYAQGAARA